MRAQLRCTLLLVSALCGSASVARADAPSGNATVPDVVGLPQAEADALLRRANFPSRFEIVERADLPLGIVVDQDPGGLAVRPNDTTILVHVAGTRPAPVVEPPVVAPPAVEPPPTPVEPPPSAPPSGELPVVPPSEPPAVPPSEPSAPALVPPVAPTPAAPALPSLVDIPQEAGLDTNGPPLANTFGLAQQEAERKLAGYQVLTEVTLTSADMQGRVVEQHPEPGTTLALGQPVTLVFGLANEPGPEYRQVPALEGLSLEQVQEKLTKAGYAMALSCVPSPNEKAGLVVSTTPHRFSFLLKGETVRVRIGRGSGESMPPPATEVPPVAPAPGGSQPPSGTLPTPSEPPPAPPPVEPPVVEPPPAPPPVEPPAVEPPTAPPPAEPLPTSVPEPTPFPAQPVHPAPGSVTLSGPAEGDSFPRAYGPTFEWTTVPNADGYEWQLEQEVAEGWRQVRTEKLIGTKFRPAQVAVGRYRWRVRALSGEVPGPWADYRRLFLY